MSVPQRPPSPTESVVMATDGLMAQLAELAGPPTPVQRASTQHSAPKHNQISDPLVYQPNRALVPQTNQPIRPRPTTPVSLTRSRQMPRNNPQHRPTSSSGVSQTQESRTYSYPRAASIGSVRHAQTPELSHSYADSQPSQALLNGLRRLTDTGASAIAQASRNRASASLPPQRSRSRSGQATQSGASVAISPDISRATPQPVSRSLVQLYDQDSLIRPSAVSDSSDMPSLSPPAQQTSWLVTPVTQQQPIEDTYPTFTDQVMATPHKEPVLLVSPESQPGPSHQQIDNSQSPDILSPAEVGVAQTPSPESRSPTPQPTLISMATRDLSVSSLSSSQTPQEHAVIIEHTSQAPPENPPPLIPTATEHSSTPSPSALSVADLVVPSLSPQTPPPVPQAPMIQTPTASRVDVNRQCLVTGVPGFVMTSAKCMSRGKVVPAFLSTTGLRINGDHEPPSGSLKIVRTDGSRHKVRQIVLSSLENIILGATAMRLAGITIKVLEKLQAEPRCVAMFISNTETYTFVATETKTMEPFLDSLSKLLEIVVTN